MKLAVVTATLDYPRAQGCLVSWHLQSADPYRLYVVGQKADSLESVGWREVGSVAGWSLWGYRTPAILGVVPAFAIGVQKALDDGAEIIACFHDDLEITGPNWDTDVIRLFDDPSIGLCGFGGGIGLGDQDIYRIPYDPMQLARHGFISNMRDAEQHGSRVLEGQRIMVLDGFSQIGRRAYWLGQPRRQEDWGIRGTAGTASTNLFSLMADWGIVHHAYDAALGCFAARLAWDVWYLPVACHHHGGLTAVADTRYHTWANDHPLYSDHRQKIHKGDAAFWAKSHRIVYDQFTDVLPLRLA